MALTMTDLVVLRLHCPKCGHTTGKDLSWLLEEDKLICQTHGCDGIINLKDGDYRTRIKKFSDLCTDLGSPTIQKIDSPNTSIAER
jgi:hypothetical protein